MDDVYLKLGEKTEQLSISTEAALRLGAGVYIQFQSQEHEILKVVYDAQEMDVYIYVDYENSYVDFMEAVAKDIIEDRGLQAIKRIKEATNGTCSLIEARDCVRVLKKALEKEERDT